MTEKHPMHFVYFVQMPLSLRDYKRYRLAEIASKGIKISVLDVADICMTGIDHKRDHYGDFKDIDITVLAENRDLARALPLLDSADLIICHVGSGHIYPENFFVMRLISKCAAPYLIFNNDMAPLSNLDVLKPSFLARLGKARLFSSFLNRIPLLALGVKPAGYVVHGGEKSLRPLRLVTAETKVFWAHSNDYELYLDEMNTPDEITDTAVFIDQNFGFHDGAKASGFTQAADPDYFYPRLRGLFERIEAELGLRVVIAAHPRADYSKMPGLFGGREIQTGNTIKLLHASKLAICSYSTAAGMAVLFRKPLFIYTLKTISNLSYAHNPPAALARAVGTLAHDLDAPDEVDLTAALDIDRKAYEDFETSYIRTSRSPKKRLLDILVDIGLDTLKPIRNKRRHEDMPCRIH